MEHTNPFLLSALICAVAIYCSFVPVRDSKAYASLVPLQTVHSIDCQLCSSPSKSADLPGAAYRCNAKLFRSFGNYQAGSIASDSAGQLVLSLPSRLVESFYPGRLYSATSGGFLMESGACFHFTGCWNETRGVFEVSGAQDLGWGKGKMASFQRHRAVARLLFKRLLYAWGRAGGLVLALLSGAREYLEPSLVESFRKAGLSHVLALSGMHLSFFSSLMGFSAARVFGKGRSFLPRLLGICLFVFFAGFSPSLFRAFLFALLLSLCARFYVSGLDGRSVLGAVFLLHVLLRREDMQTPAFMLSYAAIAGILFFSAPCERLLVPVLPPALAAPFSASLSAFLTTAPVSFCIFCSVAPVGIIASVIISPLVSLFLLASLVSLAVSLVLPGLSPLCALLLNGLYVFIERAAAFFALAPSLGFR